MHGLSEFWKTCKAHKRNGEGAGYGEITCAIVLVAGLLLVDDFLDVKVWIVFELKILKFHPVIFVFDDD